MASEYINIKVQNIKNDLTLLRNKHVYELDASPGTPKCSTLAERMENNLDNIVNEYEDFLTEHHANVSREQFDLLSGMLTRLVSEIADLSKKQPDGLLNAFKVDQINRVLKPLKELIGNEPVAEYLNFVAEVENGVEKSRNSYSDVAIILCQYREVCIKLKNKYFDEKWNL